MGEQKRLSELELDRFIQEHPNWFGITVATASQTALELGAGLVDVLRVGEGIQKGGWGYAEDGLRVLTLAGPVVRASRLGLARLVKDPGGPLCAWVATTQALRQTGNRFFATVEDLVKAAGTSAAPGSMADLTWVLKKFGAAVRDLGQPASLARLEALVSSHRNGVVLFGVTWTAKTGRVVGHGMYAFRDASGRFVIADRTGAIVSRLSQLERFYPGIGSASPHGAAILVENARVVQGTSLLSMLALEAQFISFATREQADKAIQTQRER